MSSNLRQSFHLALVVASLFFLSSRVFGQDAPQTAPPSSSLSDSTLRNLLFGNNNAGQFNAGSANISPMSLPNSIPKEYALGSGDVLLVAIFSQTYTTYQLAVTPSGTLIIPRLKEISVRGLTIDQAQARLSQEFTKVYRAAEVSVSLLKLRTFLVDVVGEVSAPARILVNAATRVSDVISQSPILKGASLRDIKIKRANPDSIVRLDVFRYFRLLDNADNLYMRENDIIEVSKQIKSVLVFGEVKYPASYPYLKTDSLFTLLQLAGGVLESAILDSVEILRYRTDQLSAYSINIDIRGYPKSANIPLQEGDRVQVRRIPFWRPDETVEVKGRVLIPGRYRIQKNKTRLRDIIQTAGGFIELASLEESYVVRPKAIRPEINLSGIKDSELENEEYQYAVARNRESPKGRMNANFRKLFIENDESQNILLEEGDVIVVPYFRSYVNVIGRVVSPGNIEYKENASADYYLQKAGGFSRKANKGDIMILKPNTGDLLEIGEIEKIEPSDVILVQEKERGRFWSRSWEVFKDTLGVVGAIATTLLLIRNLQ